MARVIFLLFSLMINSFTYADVAEDFDRTLTKLSDADEKRVEKAIIEILENKLENAKKVAKLVEFAGQGKRENEGARLALIEMNVSAIESLMKIYRTKDTSLADRKLIRDVLTEISTNRKTKAITRDLISQFLELYQLTDRR